jgi:hypothetical protein
MAFPNSTLARPQFPDLTDCVFYRLTVLARDPDDRRKWICRCRCGRVKKVVGWSLLKLKSKSCGCLRAEMVAAKNTTHGYAFKGRQRPEYMSWCAMMARCTNENVEYFHLYGGRGINVCDRWQDSFVAFLEDMGPKPTNLHQIDRIDTNGNYEPGNCRWATPSENQRNRRNNKLITAFGVTMTQAEWSERSGMPAITIHARIKKGWTTERAVTLPRHTKQRHADNPPKPEWLN